jgi:hypothetical protein
MESEQDLQIVEISDRIHALEQFCGSLDGSELTNVLLQHSTSKGVELHILERVLPQTSVPIVQYVLNQAVENDWCVFAQI